MLADFLGSPVVPGAGGLSTAQPMAWGHWHRPPGGLGEESTVGAGLGPEVAMPTAYTPWGLERTQ